MPISTLLLDAGGTLVFPNFRRIADEFARDGAPVDPDALARAEARVRFDIDRPEIVAVTDDAARWKRFMESVARAAGLARMPEAAFARLKAYHDTHNLWEHVPPDVPAALSALSRRYRLGVVSNANGTVRAKLARLGLAERFETIVDSHEEHIEKPDPRLFHVALRRMSARAEETAYVGDLYHIDVAGARAAGLHPILLDPHGFHADKPCARVASLADLANYSSLNL
ncbi:MAG: HAD family hydrolase [Planctomycetes bacterium]|nr:HAD family hydrolase [Planctomycetota bacterium]